MLVRTGRMASAFLVDNPSSPPTMKSSSILRMLAAGALLVTMAGVASAQSAAASSGTAAAASTPWAKVPAGKYHLDIQMTERMLPATLTITDSSGVPTGTLLPEGDQDAQPVTITIANPELKVNGTADRGPFEIALLRNGDELSGRWSYGGESGKLTGKVEK